MEIRAACVSPVSSHSSSLAVLGQLISQRPRDLPSRGLHFLLEPLMEAHLSSSVISMENTGMTSANASASTTGSMMVFMPRCKQKVSMLMKLRHPKIVNLFEVCEGPPTCLILEPQALTRPLVKDPSVTHFSKVPKSAHLHKR